MTGRHRRRCRLGETRLDIRALFLAHQGEVRSYLSRTLRDADAAADLTQETFLRFVEHRGGDAEAVAQPRSYLFRMAYHLAVDYIRRRRREGISVLADEGWSSLPDERPSPEREVRGRDDLATVQAALLELPERSRQVFRAVRIDGLTYQAAARRLGISESSVQKHLARALLHVMKRLGG